MAKGSLIGTISACPKLWDIAAGVLITESAGGIVTDWQGNNIFPVDLENYEGGTFQIMMANKKIHPELLQLINA